MQGCGNIQPTGDHFYLAPHILCITNLICYMSFVCAFT